MTLQWNKLHKAYDYLDGKESELYEKVKDSDDEKDMIIKRLLEEKAAENYASHCRSTY